VSPRRLILALCADQDSHEVVVDIGELRCLAVVLASKPNWFECNTSFY
jgi:hypothetical protein